jgi:adenine-specific DNA glycosylase
MAGAAKSPRQKKREIHYALACRDGKVFLVQRARDERLMAGMWELPEVNGSTSGDKARTNGADKIAALKALRHPKAKNGDHADASFTLKHSITVTDYTVRVWRVSAVEQDGGEWVAVERLSRVALTGLARKILRKAEILPHHPNGQLHHLT